MQKRHRERGSESHQDDKMAGTEREAVAFEDQWYLTFGAG